MNGAAVEWSQALTTLTPDLPAVLFVAGITALYLRGARCRPSRRPRRTAAFLTGVTVVLLSEVTAVAAFGDVLFWVHMVQHLLLTVVAAPLIAGSAPAITIRRGLSARARRVLAAGARRVVRARIAALHPLVIAVACHIVVVWVWHAPGMYDAAVASPGLHLLEHALFLGTGVWFWSLVWASARRDPRTQALATLCLAAMIVQGAALGAVLVFAGRSLYDAYDGLGALDALQDQEFAGAIMWVPPGFLYATMAVRRFVGWLAAVEQHRGRRGVGPGGTHPRGAHSGAHPGGAHPNSHPPTVRRNAS